MPNDLPASRGQVHVDGLGTFAFQPVGNTSYTTGIDVYFRPVGGTVRAPGYGRYRLHLSDELAWRLEVVQVYGLDAEIVQKGLPIAEAWLRGEEVLIFFQVHDAAAMDLAAIDRKREHLTWRLEARKAALQRQSKAGPRSNEPPTMTRGKVVAAETALADFEARMAVRETRLRELVTELRAWSQARASRTSVERIMESLVSKYEVPQNERTLDTL